MIVGIGVDTVQISRIKEALSVPNFLEDTFTKKEISNEHGEKSTYYATRFACKEAVFKALGITFDWRHVETLNDSNGKPYVNNIEFKMYNLHISITTEDDFATAFCVVEKNN